MACLLWNLNALSSIADTASRVLSMPVVMQVYAGPLKGGSRAVVFFNRHVISTQYPISNITVTWRDLGYPPGAEATVRDLHAEKDLGTFTHAFTAAVDIHDARMVKVLPKKSDPDFEHWRPWRSAEAQIPSMSLRLSMQHAES